MDIPKAEFPQEVVSIIQQIADSHFVAFDLEFSGVAGRRNATSGGKRDRLTLQEMYSDVREAAEKYQILQVGLTIVKEDQNRGSYAVYPYNFNLNPVPTLRERHLGRVWGYHSGAVSFLHNNGFRFDLPITHGVPYLSRKEENEARTNMRELDAKNAALPNMPYKDQDLPLLTHIRESVTKWQSIPKDQQEDYLNIPNDENDPAVPKVLDRYQVRLTHQTVRNEFPGLKTLGLGHFVQITNPTDTQLESQQAILDRQHEQEISKAIGFRWLMEAIMGGDISNIPQDYFATRGGVGEETRKAATAWKEQVPQLQERLRARRRIVVGHNCFTDLVNLYKCFIGDLPEKVEDFQENVHALLPAVIDTKYLASFGSNPFGDTSLGNVYRNIAIEEHPKIEMGGDFDRYKNMESYHEAGYDSLQTAKVLIKLSAQMARDNKGSSEKTALETDGSMFGVEDEYVTAPESLSDGLSQPSTIAQNITDTLASPVKAMRSLLLSGSLEEPKPAGIYSNKADDGWADTSTEASSDPTPSKVVAKKTQGLSKASMATEVGRVKSKFSSISAFDVLNAEKADSDEDATSDLLQWSDEEERKTEKREKKRVKEAEEVDRIEKMMATGQLMPRWDCPKGFWRVFGNKLQVNGTIKNVCHLP